MKKQIIGTIAFAVATAASMIGVVDNDSYAEESCTPHAVLGENKNLNFVCDENTYTVGETYTDNLGETTITAVYDVPEGGSAEIGWTENSVSENIITANMTKNFTDNFHPTSLANWFNGDEYLSLISGIENLDTSNVTSMNSMFERTGFFATSFSINLSNWDVSNVNDMYCMFSNTGSSATAWSVGDLSNWNTGNVTNMHGMFGGAGGRATTWSIGDISNWNTGKVTSMYDMFDNAGYFATNFSLDLSGWDVSNVEEMQWMFYHAGEASASFSLDLSGWDTGNVKNMYGIFQEAGSSAADWSIAGLSGWNTSKVENMGSMFENAGYSATSPIILNLSGWDTSNVISMGQMFYNIPNLATIVVGPNWNTDTVEYSDNMFYNNTTLVGEKGTIYSDDNANDATLAHVDGGIDNPGYLTLAVEDEDNTPTVPDTGIFGSTGKTVGLVALVAALPTTLIVAYGINFTRNRRAHRVSFKK